MLYEVLIIIEKRLSNSMIYLFAATIERQAFDVYWLGELASQGKLFLRQVKPHDKTSKWQMNDG